MTVLVDKKLSERFEVAFNQIHSWLQKNVRNARSDKFTDLLKIGFPSFSIIRKYYHDLKMYGRLRNSIVHDKVELGFYIAEPHESVVDKIEKIAAQLTHPKAAVSIATKPVIYFHENTKLSEVLTAIQQHAYSVFPIYDTEGYKWLLTSENIIQWFAKNMIGTSIQINEVEIKDLFPLGKSYLVEFAPKEAGMFEIEEYFENYHLKGKKLEAVIITETGLKTQKPIGIVTSWDLVEIDVLD
ncbi:CBS domain-containing protein [Neobacillus mesonae]|uniref:CBS domain-containing protein n=1 Tax=Neobacillus mesonae TaxID=1193713 RepID=UPI00203C71DD|nr:CBS domain-containing protein [Neobacillus mesonae]MCM3567074.1 CBS domain-containing protein [Neobacillus mesonae]